MVKPEQSAAYLEFIEGIHDDFANDRMTVAVFEHHCANSPALNAYAHGKAWRHRSGPRLGRAMFWHVGGSVFIWNDETKGGVLFNETVFSTEDNAYIDNHKDFLEMSGLWIDAELKAENAAAYDCRCKAVSDLIEARRCRAQWVKATRA